MTSPLRIGFFGPAGTFTEQALLTQSDLATATTVAYRTVPDVLDAVESGEVDLGFVPIENSIEGTVNFTQDALVFDHDLLIQREVVLDIEHCVLAKKGRNTCHNRDAVLHSGCHCAMPRVCANTVRQGRSARSKLNSRSSANRE